TRAPQRNIDGWVARKRPGTVSAAAAERARQAAEDASGGAATAREGEPLHGDAETVGERSGAGDTASE
ncbi:MAG: bifunctional UDP-N-acetylglucosamine diphosphorylase/glucosamine-1-phosphate N-acetyltransferase GlmU, partial [Micromonospora sp.]